MCPMSRANAARGRSEPGHVRRRAVDESEPHERIEADERAKLGRRRFDDARVERRGSVLQLSQPRLRVEGEDPGPPMAPLVLGPVWCQSRPSNATIEPAGASSGTAPFMSSGVGARPLRWLPGTTSVAPFSAVKSLSTHRTLPVSGRSQQPLATNCWSLCGAIGPPPGPVTFALRFESRRCGPITIRISSRARASSASATNSAPLLRSVQTRWFGRADSRSPGAPS